MYTKKQHVFRKSLITVSSLLLGSVITIVAAATYDASIQERASKMVTTIKSNANSLNEADRPVYYSLVRKNIQSLIQVLTEVDAVLKPLSDDSALITPEEILTITIGGSPTGIVYCGDPTRNDYMVYAYSNGTVRFYKNPCVTDRGGKVWAKCTNGTQTDIKTVGTTSTVQLICTTGQQGVTPIDTTNSCKWSYHAVFGPVGPLDMDPAKVKCSTSNNGVSAYEVGGSKQKVATCGCEGASTTPITTNPTTPTNSCKWQGHSVFGPVGPVDIDTTKIACTTAYNGVSSYEVGGSKQKVSTCVCEVNTTTPTTPTTTSQPKVVLTTSNYTTLKSTFTLGETVYGYIQGGDPANTWMCLDVPGGNGCPSGVGWRQMTKPYRGTAPDEWQYNATNKRIELTGLNLGNDSGAGLYKGYVRTGTSGTPSMIEVTIKAADASSPNVSCNWQAQSVFGPVGATNINTAQVACNATTAGEIAYEVGGSRQITSICKCDSTVTPLSKAKTYYTNSTYSALRDSIFLGENVYAIVAGGNPADTWGCIDTPASNNCPSGVGWRKLTVPYNGGTPDEWQYNAANKRIELSAFYIYPSYPVGTYKGYTRNGANGEYTVTNFTVQSQLQWSCGAVFGPIQVPPISECSYEGKNVPVNGAPDGCTCVKK